MRPELMQTLSQGAIALGIVITAVGGWGAYYFGNKVQDAKDVQAQDSEGQLHAQVRELVEGNRRLEQRLEPFVELAQKAHPSIERDAALGRLLREFESGTAKSGIRGERRTRQARRCSIRTHRGVEV